MEGMWTRFFPAVEKAEEIIRSGAIGKVVAVHSDFGFNGADVAEYPDHIFYDLNLGGGGLFYVAPYPVAVALQFLGPAPPSRIAAAGVKDKLTGVDLSGAISLHFEGQGIASLTYNIEVGAAPLHHFVVAAVFPLSHVSTVKSLVSWTTGSGLAFFQSSLDWRYRQRQSVCTGRHVDSINLKKKFG